MTANTIKIEQLIDAASTIDEIKAAMPQGETP
jgi:hypothetical protein